jgi:hypothetical protein
VSYISDGVGFSVADGVDDAVDKSGYKGSRYRNCNIVNPALQMQLRMMINGYGNELEKTTLKAIEKMSLHPDKKKQLWLPIFISLFVLFETAEWDLYEGVSARPRFTPVSSAKLTMQRMTADCGTALA